MDFLHFSEKQTEKWDNCLINQKENSVWELCGTELMHINTLYKPGSSFSEPQIKIEQQKKKAYHSTHTEVFFMSWKICCAKDTVGK